MYQLVHSLLIDACFIQDKLGPIDGMDDGNEEESDSLHVHWASDEGAEVHQVSSQAPRARSHILL